MRYLEEINGVAVRREVTSHFFITEEQKNQRIIAARFSNEQGRNPEEGYAFLGSFLSTDLFTHDEDYTDNILTLFQEMDSSTSSYFLNKYSESKNDLLFSFNQPKSKFFAGIRKTFTGDDEIRIHCLGDIFEFHYHYMESEDMEFTMKRCVDRRHPMNQEGGKLTYICLESFFEEEEEVVAYMRKCRAAYEKAIADNKGQKEEVIQKKVNDSLLQIANEFVEAHPEVVNDDELNMDFASLRDREVVVENLRRFFCLGCLINNCKKTTPNYALTIIDENDQIKTWVTNSIVIDTLKEEYDKMGGDEKYGKIEHFLMLHDLLIKRKDKEEVEIKVVPTKYSDLEGSILTPNIRYWIMTVVIDFLGYVNKFNDKIINYFDLKNSYSPVSVVTVTEGKVSFRMIDSEEPFRIIDYKPFEYEEESDFNTEFLEI